MSCTSASVFNTTNGRTKRSLITKRLSNSFCLRLPGSMRAASKGSHRYAFAHGDDMADVIGTTGFVIGVGGEHIRAVGQIIRAAIG
jgi:hypothetical protein